MDHKRPLTIAEKNRQKAIENKEMRNDKLEMKVNAMSDKEIQEELKKKGLPTFGTKFEREMRLRKALGLTPNGGEVRGGGPGPSHPSSAIPAPKGNSDKTVNEIERIKQKREERRKEIERNVRKVSS